MQFSATETIQAPADVIFDRLCEFRRYEEATRRRGVHVVCVDPNSDYGVGTQWEIQVPLPTGMRPLMIALTERDAPSVLRFSGRGNWAIGSMAITLTPKGDGRTEMSVVIDFKPASLAARMVMQAVKLAKFSLDERFRSYVRKFANDVEQEFNPA
ncbi:MAG: SRPBCC family protein [Marinibacterium sp.]|nr:SRPBCC family protein [Marinibacterium sp.]